MIVERHFLKASHVDRNISAMDETWLSVKLPRGACLVGVGQSARDPSTPFEPVSATCEIAAFVMPDKHVYSVTAATRARELREVVERQFIAGIAYSETIAREYYEDLRQTSLGLDGVPCNAETPNDPFSLVFYFRQVDSVAHDFRGYYDIGARCKKCRAISCKGCK